MTECCVCVQPRAIPRLRSVPHVQLHVLRHHHHRGQLAQRRPQRLQPHHLTGRHRSHHHLPMVCPCLRLLASLSASLTPVANCLSLSFSFFLFLFLFGLSLLKIYFAMENYSMMLMIMNHVAILSWPACLSPFESLRPNRLVGLVVRRPPRERKIPGSNPACTGIFSGSSHTSDLKIGTPVATLPGAWRHRVSAGTGRPGVSIL